MSAQAHTLGAQRIRGLRTNSLAAVLLLLVEFGLGIWVNLYGTLPAMDRGAGIPAAFGRAVAHGPVGLSIHALVGIGLILSALSALLRSVLVGRPALIAATFVGLVGILDAALSGARFVGHGDSASSMSMAVGAGVAIGAYAVVLFISGSHPPSGPASLQRTQERG